MYRVCLQIVFPSYVPMIDRNLRFEIGLKLEYSSNSKFFFFSLGFNIASSSCVGMHPVSSDLLIMLASVDSRVSFQLLGIVAGLSH